MAIFRPLTITLAVSVFVAHGLPTVAASATSNGSTQEERTEFVVLVYNHVSVPGPILTEAEAVAARIFNLIGIEVSWTHCQHNAPFPCDNVWRFNSLAASFCFQVNTQTESSHGLCFVL